MKKYGLIVLVLVGLAAAVYAAAPLARNFASNTGDKTVTYPATTSVTAWQIIDSLIVVASDSSNVMVSVTGSAVFNRPGGFYLGFSSDSAGVATAGATLDTFLVKYSSIVQGSATLPFGFRYSKLNNGALTDTIYLKARNISTGTTTSLLDVSLSAQVADQ